MLYLAGANKAINGRRQVELGHEIPCPLKSSQRKYRSSCKNLIRKMSGPHMIFSEALGRAEKCCGLQTTNAEESPECRGWLANSRPSPYGFICTGQIAEKNPRVSRNYAKRCSGQRIEEDTNEPRFGVSALSRDRDAHWRESHTKSTQPENAETMG